jgi:hypothetical protein
MKSEIALILEIQSALTWFAQSNPDNTKRYFSRTIKKVPTKVLENKTIGVADTTLACVVGQIVDDKNTPVYFAEVSFRNMRDTDTVSFQTDSSGHFKLYTSAGNYTILFHDSPYGSLNISSLKLLSGQIQEIKVSLGSRFVVEEWQTVKEQIVSDTTGKRKNL